MSGSFNSAQVVAIAFVAFVLGGVFVLLIMRVRRALNDVKPQISKDLEELLQKTLNTMHELLAINPVLSFNLVTSDGLTYENLNNLCIKLERFCETHDIPFSLRPVAEVLNNRNWTADNGSPEKVIELGGVIEPFDFEPWVTEIHNPIIIPPHEEISAHEIVEQISGSVLSVNVAIFDLKLFTKEVQACSLRNGGNLQFYEIDHPVVPLSPVKIDSEQTRIQ